MPRPTVSPRKKAPPLTRPSEANVGAAGVTATPIPVELPEVARDVLVELHIAAIGPIYAHLRTQSPPDPSPAWRLRSYLRALHDAGWTEQELDAALTVTGDHISRIIANDLPDADVSDLPVPVPPWAEHRTGLPRLPARMPSRSATDAEVALITSLRESSSHVRSSAPPDDPSRAAARDLAETYLVALRTGVTMYRLAQQVRVSANSIASLLERHGRRSEYQEIVRQARAAQKLRTKQRDRALVGLERLLTAERARRDHEQAVKAEAARKAAVKQERELREQRDGAESAAEWERQQAGKAAAQRLAEGERRHRVAANAMLAARRERDRRAKLARKSAQEAGQERARGAELTAAADQLRAPDPTLDGPAAAMDRIAELVQLREAAALAEMNARHLDERSDLSQRLSQEKAEAFPRLDLPSRWAITEQHMAHRAALARQQSAELQGLRNHYRRELGDLLLSAARMFRS